MLAVSFAAAAVDSFSTAAPAAPLTSRTALVQIAGVRGTGPIIARYQSDDGGAFVLDRSTPRPLLKFEDNAEIWVLQPGAGPRGDTLYRNDLGQTMLRATRLGGMTVFTDRRPDGSAAALEGASSPLRIAEVSAYALYNHVYQASVRASRAAQHQVGIETREDATPATAGLIADAAWVASQAMVDIASKPGGKALLGRVTDVLIGQGPKPYVTLQKSVLTVVIAPAQGVAGRPSSRRIEVAAGMH